jgi:5-(carboxyamino)imidazole ribonucleotide synthase
MDNGSDLWIGVLGGGQLGRMLSLDARRMGYKVLTWTGGDRSGAAATADHILDEPFEDKAALEKFTNKVGVATVEFENLPQSTLEEVEQRIPLYPSSEAVSICQHREREKTFLSQNRFACANFRIAKDLQSFKTGLKELDCDVIVKTAEFGYDGKGQLKLMLGLSDVEIDQAWKSLGGGRVVIEECISLETEVSVLVVRNKNGQVATYDPVENIHRNHILDISIVPARVSENILSDAKKLALEVAESLNYIGILAVEFFISSDGRLLINEIAPRPHNSGHHTINACVCSQFENQARAINGLPPGSTRLLSPVVMMNLLGDLWPGKHSCPDWSAITNIPGASLHLYGKREARKGRKMGHISILGKTIDEVTLSLNSVREGFSLPKV